MRDVKFYATRQCNARCAFCFAHIEEDLGKEKFEKDLQRLANINEPFSLNVTGGEPSLRMPRVRKLYELFKSHPRAERMVVYSNGTIIEKDALFLKKDSEREIHINLSIHSMTLNLDENFRKTGIRINQTELLEFNAKMKNVSLVVVVDEMPTQQAIKQLAIKAKSYGFKSVRIRLQFDRFAMKPMVSYGRTESCDVCYTDHLFDCAIPSSIHWGVAEPTAVRGYEEYEFIINDGVFWNYARTIHATGYPKKTRVLYSNGSVSTSSGLPSVPRPYPTTTYRDSNCGSGGGTCGRWTERSRGCIDSAGSGSGCSG